MKLVFSPSAWSDYLYWQQTDPAVLARANEVIRDALRSPFTGIGKPEPLVGTLKGWWSRRLTREHRLVYRVTGTGETQALEIAGCRFHYER
jgi:toxin YoeB